MAVESGVGLAGKEDEEAAEEAVAWTSLLLCVGVGPAPALAGI